LDIRRRRYLSFDDDRIHGIAYEETAAMQIVRRFLNNREGFLEELFKETLSLFED